MLYGLGRPQTRHSAQTQRTLNRTTGVIRPSDTIRDTSSRRSAVRSRPARESPCHDLETFVKSTRRTRHSSSFAAPQLKGAFSSPVLPPLSYIPIGLPFRRDKMHAALAACQALAARRRHRVVHRRYSSNNAYRRHSSPSDRRLPWLQFFKQAEAGRHRV